MPGVPADRRELLRPLPEPQLRRMVLGLFDPATRAKHPEEAEKMIDSIAELGVLAAAVGENTREWSAEDFARLLEDTRQSPSP